MLAVITGVTGQDGSYLSELLLNKDYFVVGVARRTSSENTQRISHLLDNKKFILVEGDVTDITSMRNILLEYVPDEVYNLAAQSHVGTSFKQPEYTWNATANGCMNILNILKDMYKMGDSPKFYQASSSEMFGSSVDSDGYQRESTIMRPQSPYAIAKLAAHHTTRLYRESYNMFCCSGILFNHESERRGTQFVTRKIVNWIIKYGLGKTKEPLKIGNLYSSRDWGYAPDYVEGMHMMISHKSPQDFVLATGETHTVLDFINEAFKYVYDVYSLKLNLSEHVVVDNNLIRPAEVNFLKGDASKAKYCLKWQPKHNFKQLVKKMIDEERKLELAK